jgi:hypothetical protein
MNRHDRRLLPLAFVAALVALASPSTARADPAESATGPEQPLSVLRPAAEVNVLWPFIGISEMKVLVPLFGGRDFRGELLTGVYLDYAQIVRTDKGKTFIIAPMIGYRQFFAYGIHAELALDIGWRHETGHPGDGATLDDAYVRAWPMAGYQLELSPRFYVNARAGAGLLVYRQTHYDEEKKVSPGGDVNVGARF